MFAPENRGKVIEKTEEGYNVSMNLLKKGYLSEEELESYPGVKSLKVIHPVIECSQNIPCNPCQDACSKNCITIGDKITSLPVVNEDATCTGCGLCVAACSGQSIFLVDESQEEGYTYVTIPYEFLPLPQKGDKGLGLDRSGTAVGEAEVVKVKTAKTYDHTYLLTIKVPTALGMKVRFYKQIQEVSI